MQTHSKLPQDLLELYQLITLSANTPATFLNLYAQTQKISQVKRVVDVLGKETLQQIMCYFESGEALGSGFSHCQQFCRNYYEIRQRQQSVEKQKSLNLTTILVFMVIKLLCITFLYTIIAHTIYPLLDSSQEINSHPQWPLPIKSAQPLQVSIMSLLWPFCLSIYTLGGIVLSVGLIVHSAKSYVRNCGQLGQIKRQKGQLINGEGQ